MVIGTCSSDDTTLFWIGSGSDVVAVDGEHGHVVGCLGDIKGIGGIGRDLYAILGPLGESVASIGGSRQGAAGTMVEGASAADGASFFWDGSDADAVTVEGEMGYV